MKLLSDENLPVKLKYRFTDNNVDAYTLKDMHWLGKANGELLQLMIQYNFTSFLTIDSNLSFQQNFENYPLQVIIIIAPDNTYQTIMQIFQHIIKSLTSQNKIISIVHPMHSTF